MDPLSYFSFHPLLYDWCNKDCGMCYPVCWIMHIKHLCALNRNDSPCSGVSGFPLLLSGPLPYVWCHTLSVVRAFARGAVGSLDRSFMHLLFNLVCIKGMIRRGILYQLLHWWKCHSNLIPLSVSAIPHSVQCSTTGVTKAGVCAILSEGWSI